MNYTSVEKIRYNMHKNLLQKFEMNDQQQQAFDAMAKGINVFITGPSGVGKSTIIKIFQNIYSQNKVISITSTTGVSALLIGGTTLHSYLGIGLGTNSVGALTTKILKKTYLRNRWKNLDTLVIDEISMLSPELFDKLEEIARNVRNSTKPFGGIQLILSGDFCQLPVVNSDRFCFEANKWDECVDKVIHLTTIIRQHDTVFQQCLNEIRFGNVTKNVKELLTKCIKKKFDSKNGIKPTRLYTTNADVDEINEQELDNLANENTQFYQYDMKINVYETVFNREETIEKFRKNCIAPTTLYLCLGAQVMLLYNLDTASGLVNGSRGVVVGFIEDKPLVRFISGVERIIDYNIWEYEEMDKKILSMRQIPLKLAWALTIHKSQGQTLDCMEVDLSNVFDYGQAYVALSRVKDISGLSIIDIDFKKIRAHPKAIKFYNNL